MPVIAKRVNRLEHIVEDFVASVGVEYNKLCNSQMRRENGISGAFGRG